MRIENGDAFPSNTLAWSDLDGDGLPEQIVAAGEATPGLFIGAWHSLEWDLESDSTLEMSMVRQGIHVNCRGNVQ